MDDIFTELRWAFAECSRLYQLLQVHEEQEAVTMADNKYPPLTLKQLAEIRADVQAHRENTLTSAGREEFLSIIDEVIRNREFNATHSILDLETQLATVRNLLDQQRKLIEHLSNGHKDPYGICHLCGNQP